jgi:hypothetical protein
MKKAVTFMLFFAVLIHSMSRWLTYASFKLNQNYIAKNICINRNDPTTGCEGSCQLRLMLKQQENQKKEASFTFQLKETVIITAEKLDVVFGLKLELLIFYGIYITEIKEGFLYKLFHPPKYFYLMQNDF